MGPLISAGQRETVASLRARRRAGGDPRHRARRARLLVPADRAVPGRPRRPRRDARRSSGRSPCVDPVRRRGGGGRGWPTTRSTGCPGSVWTRDGAQGAARRPRARDRRHLDQLEHVGARRDAVRRLQAVRRRARARPARARALHRGQDRLLRDGASDAGRLDGKVGVITGAAGGIGAETARLFAEEGATVVGVDLGPTPDGRARRSPADVTDEDAGARRCTRRCASEFGRIDVLFNNAGISPPDDGSVLDTSLEAWQRVQDVNLKSVFLCCKHGIPHLLDDAAAARSSTPRRSSP